MIKFGIGALVGAGLVFVFLAYGPKGTEAKARAAGATVAEKADETRYSYCQKEFLEETQCFQKLPSTQCVSLIAEKCGKTETTKP